MKPFSLIFTLTFSLSLFSAPIRDDLAARSTTTTADRPHAAFIEYLESTGTQWIDTGISASTEVRPIRVAFQGVSSGGSNFYFLGGGNSSSEGYGFRLYTWNKSTLSAGFGWTKTLNYWNYAHSTVNNYDVLAITGSSGWMSLNGSGPNTLSFHATYDYTFALFGRNVGGVVSPVPIRIYFAQIGDLDLVPIRIGNIGYMIDLVSGEIFENQGTGDFLLGPDIAPLNL